MIKKLVVISFSFTRGGAAVAANRFTSIADSFPHVDVIRVSQDDAGLFDFFKRLVSHSLLFFVKLNNPAKQSINFFSAQKTLVSLLNRDAIFHFHWINNDTLSIFDLKKIPTGSIISLHDEWFFQGIEHSSVPDLFKDKPTFFYNVTEPFRRRFDSWLRDYKKNFLLSRRDLVLTVPSTWMLARAETFKILEGCDFRLLPNPIDTQLFEKQTQEQVLAFKQRNSIPQNKLLIGFGASNSNRNVLKGVHLLEQALAIVLGRLPDDLLDNLCLIDFGGNKALGRFLNVQRISLGHISRPEDMATLYSALNCMVVPSITESFGQVAAESLSCETPVISFRCTGLTDIVIDGVTGFTASPYSVEDLAEVILRFIHLDPNTFAMLKYSARMHVVKNFSYEIVAEKYKKLLFDVVSD
jgi:glycosyltransferase involved in cell wall biosynthesis